MTDLSQATLVCLTLYTQRNKKALLETRKEIVMGKAIYCNKVNPSSECNHVIRGETEDDVLQKAGVHAKEHGLEATPELIEKVRSNIEDE
jgi:predicted small metal-binding protein